MGRSREEQGNTKRTDKGGTRVGKIIKRILLVFALLIFMALIAAGVWFYDHYGRDILAFRTEMQSIAARSTRDDFASAQTSICYYSDGSVMQILAGEKNVYYLPYKAIPKDAVNAVLAVEDRKFFSHKGYDVYAIGRAAKALIQNDGEIKQGGSTITQQLARNIYLTNEKTVERKVREIFLAAALERKYSKYDILEFYLNNIYFANGYYGLQAASKGYFGVTAGDLSLSKLAFLCGIPNSPTSCNPVTHYDNALERRDKVLKQMYETGYIGADEYQTALAEKITLVSSVSEMNNYEETYTYKCAVQELMEAEGFKTRYSFENEEDESLYNELYNAEYSRMRRNLYAKGYRIYTSINPVKQEALQEAVDEELSQYTELSDEGIYKLQSAAVCIDNDTGFVVAIVGGRSQETSVYTLNRAYQSPRQPGSSIKPLIVYTPYFELGNYPDSTVVDEKIEGGPRNSGGVYSGEIDVRYAVTVSKNTVAWKLFGELGISTGLSYLKRMNFAHIVDTDYFPAAALGGLTYGATAVEMTSAYATIENDGVYRTPTCILRITDSNGNAIIDNTARTADAVNTVEEKRVYEKNASRMMTDVLTSVMTSGTGRKVSLEGHICAGKTGTTTNQKDGWFVGFTRYYTTGVWVGFDMPKALEELKGNTYPAYIWQHFMQQIHENLEDRPFEAYVDLRPVPPVPDEAEAGAEEDADIEEAIMGNAPVYAGVDVDGDGIPDGYYMGPTTDGVYPYGWIDVDGDGTPDGYPYGWVDNDGDQIPDGYPEGLEDGDNDGVPDLYELEETIWVRPGENYEWVTQDDEYITGSDEEMTAGDDYNGWTSLDEAYDWVNPREQ